jgi:ABC-2 type transport system permease protein
MLKERIKNIYLSRHVLWGMVVKQLKAKYSGSILGISWAILNPILIMVAISFVFGVVFKAEIKNFGLFLLSGILPWMFFSVSLSEATFSILNQIQLLRQFNIPKEFLPLSSILANFLNFLLGLAFIFPIFLIFKPKVIFLLPLLAIVLILHLFFTMGLGLLLSVLNVFFRDIGHLLSILLMFWFWITPIFYSIEMVPLSYRWIVNLNPMMPYMVSYQDVLFFGNISRFYIFLGAFFWAFFSITLGLSIFFKFEPNLFKRI